MKESLRANSTTSHYRIVSKLRGGLACSRILRDRKPADRA